MTFRIMEFSYIRSLRSLQRNARKERERYQQILLAAKNTQQAEIAQTSHQNLSEQETELSNFMEGPTQEPLRNRLRKWFLEYNPSVQSCNNLLKILAGYSLDVPSSVGGLIGQKEKCVIRTVAPGEYVHIGLERQLEKAKDLLQQHSILELDICRN